MKKTLAILLAMLMLVSVLAACSNEPAPTTPSTDAPATTDTPATSEPADEPAEEPADAPADTPTDAPADDSAPSPAPEIFTGSVKVKLQNKGDVFEGDKLTFKAEVKGNKALVTIHWQKEVEKDEKTHEKEWITQKTGEKFSIEATEANAAQKYRVVLLDAEGTVVAKAAVKFPKIQPKAASELTEKKADKKADKKSGDKDEKKASKKSDKKSSKKPSKESGKKSSKKASKKSKKTP